jgi:hypothetical protein
LSNNKQMTYNVSITVSNDKGKSYTQTTAGALGVEGKNGQIELSGETDEEVLFKIYMNSLVVFCRATNQNFDEAIKKYRHLTLGVSKT